MSRPQPVFIGTDSGATTSKTGGVWPDGSVISTQLRQSSTNTQAGTAAVIAGWVEGVGGFLRENRLEWSQVEGVGLAIPGPYLRYGVLGRSANLPHAFEGWDFHSEYAAALAAAAGRPVALAAGNDGTCGGRAEAQRARGEEKASVLMLAPGSGLGCAFIDAEDRPLEGDNFAGMEAAHMPAPLHLLGVRPYPCGCGRTWGCVEAYTTLSGLGHLLDDALARHPEHEFAASPLDHRKKVLALRDRAQANDPLALEIFDFQAKALGLHLAALTMALDPGYVVIGGGLMDRGSTTQQFRDRYLRILGETAKPYLFPVQRERLKIVPASLGDLSQAIGAALMARQAKKEGKVTGSA